VGVGVLHTITHFQVLCSTIQGYSALTYPAGLHPDAAKAGELSTEACSRTNLAGVDEGTVRASRSRMGLQSPH